MSNRKLIRQADKFDKELRRDLINKSTVLPLLLVVVTIIACLVLSNPNLGLFPNQNNTEQTTSNYEYEEDGFSMKGE